MVEKIHKLQIRNSYSSISTAVVVFFILLNVEKARVDCALGIQPACQQLIDNWTKEKKE